MFSRAGMFLACVLIVLLLMDLDVVSLAIVR